jgi:hypothetical protein
VALNHFDAQREDSQINSKNETVETCDQRILFVTPYALSGRTAIGVQTKFLLKQFTNWVHLSWEPEKGTPQLPNSHRAEIGLLPLWPFTTGRGFLWQLINRSGLSWWRNDRLCQRYQKWLLTVAQDTQACYLAPLDASGATRCRHIVELINRPFVVHLWDILDGSPSADLRWLLERAEHVFCVSKPLFNDAAAFNSSVDYLRFQRSGSRFLAKPPGPTETFRIALIGHLNSYQDGLALLMGALQQLKQEGTRTEVIYIGPKQGLHLLPRHLREMVASVGFLSDERRDAVLSSCHAGFLPGPLKPQTDGRSKYSIPSRLLDFFAVALPVIAAVHPGSATANFLAPIAGKATFLLQRTEEICRVIQALRERSCWQEASARSLAFGGEFEASANDQKLVDHFKKRAPTY